MRTEDRDFVAAVPRFLYKCGASRHTKPLLSALCLLPSIAVAAEEARPAYIPPPPAVSSGSLVQIIFSLLLVLAAIVLVAWLLKRMNMTQQGSGNLLKVLGGVSIGQRERIVLVEINDTWLVVGVGPGQIRTLHTLPKAEDIGQTENTTFVAHPPENKFAALLSSIVRPQPSDKKHDAP
jgi:flagellar protein FliO/FliZ